MSDETTRQPTPAADLKRLECLIGTWKVSDPTNTNGPDGSTGDTFDYVYELDGDTLTIWGGEIGSPAFYKGTFSSDGNTLTGSWTWPGGGYESTSTRVPG